jgi:hypothetical protein
MSDVDILRCPSCGAVLTDKASGKCEYCGAVWEHHDASQYGDQAAKLHAGETYYFKHLPGVAITTKTKEIPFQPQVLFNQLPGGQVPPSLKNDADVICSLSEKMQRGCNTEDIDLYMSPVSPDNQEFYQKVKKGAVDQFITSDMKRYTVSIDFLNLTADSAMADVTIEAIIFRSADTTTQLEVTFRNTLKKINGEWKVINAEFRPQALNLGSVGLGKVPKATWIVPLVGLAIGLIAALGVTVAVLMPNCEGAFDQSSEQSGSIGTPQESSAPSSKQPYKKNNPKDKEQNLSGGWKVSKDPLVIYSSPDSSLQPSYIIMPEVKYQVLQKSGVWSQIRTEDGRTGWTPTQMIEK